MPISQVVDVATLEERIVRESDGAGGLVEVTGANPVWLEPIARYGTPIRRTLGVALAAVGDGIAVHPDSFPPASTPIVVPPTLAPELPPPPMLHLYLNSDEGHQVSLAAGCALADAPGAGGNPFIDVTVREYEGSIGPTHFF